MEQLPIQLGVMVVFGAIVAVIANGRGRSPLGWFFIGFIAPCIGLILVLVLPDLKVQEEREKNLRRDNRRLRERVKKNRAVADQRHEQSGKRLAAHDAMLGLDTGGEGQERPPELPQGLAEQQAADEAHWHYARAGSTESQGPVSIETLRQLRSAGELNEQCLFWCKGMDTWLSLVELPELEALLADE